jgi:nicotinate phosphoribosyltransferase
VEGEKLLRPAMRAGQRVPDLPDLEAARRCAAASLAQLPPALRHLQPGSVQVEISAGIRALAERTGV